MTHKNNISFRKQYHKFLHSHAGIFSFEERNQIRIILREYFAMFPAEGVAPGKSIADKIQIVEVLLDEIGLGKAAVLSVLFHELVEKQHLSVADIESKFNTQVSSIINGMMRVEELYARNASLETENFRKLFLTFAEDVRVILIIIAEHLQIMRTLHLFPEDKRQNIAREASFLYAPLAHRMGLYAVKTELEDLSLKYTNREIYNEIAYKLSDTKRERDKFIADFIAPLKEKMSELGFQFTIKGRTKSINSIYSKIKKQNTSFENIYDLFAIRIIFDVPLDKEKAACWQAYSIVADMYQPNPKRLRDWLSIPKTNGYESLHTTVLGPEGKWVEVQIRTVRMDEVAEKGLAAHWKYKGIKSESGMDEWLTSIREILENPELNAVDFMDEFKLNLYDKEVFVFTPSGDLHKLPKGATALDFAFSIHSNIGCKCVGAKVNGKNMPIKYVLNNGDQVEVLTSPTQKPNPAWLNVVTTSRAKTKIRQALKEVEFKDAEIGRETLVRRFKNWKIELEDGKISRLAKKKGFKTVSDFYQEIARENLDVHVLRDAYLDLDKPTITEQPETRRADAFSKEPELVTASNKDDVLVIGADLKGVDFKLAKCCNPIYGDDVFGFVAVAGGIKIHKTDCPNAPQMIARFGYRIVKARWSGKSVGSQYPITLRIVGHDDIGIVTNITSLISKEKNISLRSISIDSNAGLFQGNLTIMVNDTKDLEAIVKKIQVVKGVKNVSRS
ncbi:RelA/SpoT family protein [Paludibacter propionicigenes WB4]|uniref:RelA/SpoT family protein n=1 Tax=Paludibacter propionicigenes (strain DSM 17365 / JCM 13257 / WB4) TaxID=694427 RepID=E4T4H8_PALPW|nr:RelA/SpoT family protein [Paludibacter propionicigenes]ADQ79622.1 RelA/SpoT family protein [Paludibacter propionicigenes WB4]